MEQDIKVLENLTGAFRSKVTEFEDQVRYELEYFSLRDCHKALKQLQLGGYPATKVKPGRRNRDYRIVITFDTPGAPSKLNDWYGDLTRKSAAGPRDTLQKHTQFDKGTPNVNINLPELYYRIAYPTSSNPSKFILYYKDETGRMEREVYNLGDMRDVLKQMRRDGYQNINPFTGRPKRKKSEPISNVSGMFDPNTQPKDPVPMWQKLALEMK